MVSPLFPLRCEAAESHRRGKRLIGPIDITLEASGPIALIGPNGAGKTTLLRLMNGAARLSRGQIHWACDTETAQAAQAFVFQRPVMLRRSVMDNLTYPLKLKGTPRADARRAAEHWAAQVGLSALLPRQATSLSGGEQQKLAIARALITQPRLLFLDEPTAALDGRTTREIEAILHSAAQSGTQIILSTHDLGQAQRLAEVVLFLYAGRIHESAPASSFFAQPETPKAQAFLRGDIVE